MIQFLVGVLIGMAVVGFAAKGYIMSQVAAEREKLSTQYEALRTSIDARVAAIRKTAAEKVAGK